jgi:hypothetical protein
VGDDLLCTNPVRVQKAIDTKACNALLLKVRSRAAARASGGGEPSVLLCVVCAGCVV